MKHTISILVENSFGAFDRVATMFSAKGFNLHSLTIGETEIRDISRMTIVTSGDDQMLGQVVKQLNRLIDTIKVYDLTKNDRTERELALITVLYQKGVLEELKNINDIFRGKVLDVSSESYTVEITGDENKMLAIIDLFAPMGIKDIARTGSAALTRGNKTKAAKVKKQLD